MIETVNIVPLTPWTWRGKTRLKLHCLSYGCLTLDTVWLMAKQAGFWGEKPSHWCNQETEESLGNYLNKVGEPCAICGKYKTLHRRNHYSLFPVHTSGYLRLSSNEKRFLTKPAVCPHTSQKEQLALWLIPLVMHHKIQASLFGQRLL